MLFQNVISANGPFPVKGTFNAESDDARVIFVSGSVWSNTAGQWVGVQILLDGTFIGDAVIFCNEATSHRAFIPVMIPATVAFGSHTITLQASGSSTVADINDFFNVYIMY